MAAERAPLSVTLLPYTPKAPNWRRKPYSGLPGRLPLTSKGAQLVTIEREDRNEAPEPSPSWREFVADVTPAVALAAPFGFLGDWSTAATVFFGVLSLTRGTSAGDR